MTDLHETHDRQHRALLQKIARGVMFERGMLPEFSEEALTELGRMDDGGAVPGGAVRDLRNLLWCSIDNDDSRDLDQLSVAVAVPGGAVKVLVAIADVDALVKRDSAIDRHAQHNTTSIYTAAEIFPMLPEQLSTDLTSLNLDADRYAVVVEMTVGADGELAGSDLYRAVVRNHAKLAYNSLAAWLEEGKPMPDAVAAVTGLADNIRLQHGAAHHLRALRHLHGALDLETIESRPVFAGEELTDLAAEMRNGAKDIIEDFMIAANGVTARYLAAKKFPSLRRVVRVPKRWDRIVELAGERQYVLPQEPDPASLDKFLLWEKGRDPLRFPDLSLSVIKLLGFGEYIVELPGDRAVGHFGLAVKDYAHSTAPNRRYPDLITQRLLKAALAGAPAPYTESELGMFAKRCTEQEDVAKKIERQVRKSAEAMVLEAKIGEKFDAIVTGASDKGTWVRLLHPSVEGKLVSGFEGKDVGQQLRVQLLRVDIRRGFIDFKLSR